MNKTIAIFTLAAAVTSAAVPARASTFSVTGSGSTFTISRSGDTSAAETVLFRTVPLSAFPGQHYTEKSDTLVFAPAQTATNIVVSESSPSIDAYKYRTGVSSRAYRFELTDRAGALLDVRERLVSSGLASVPSSGAFDVKDLVITNGTITVTDGGYGQAYHSVPVSSYYNAAAPKNYLAAVGATLRMTVTFDAREGDDGYQYVQIYANTPADDDHTDTGAKNGNPGDYNYARYAAGFTIDGNVSSTYYPYTFPLTSAGHNCGAQAHPWSGNSNGNLEQQFFQSNCRASDGRLIVPTSLTSLYIRLNASGNFGDTWYAKNVKAHIQAVDSTKPTKLADPVVAPGPYRYGTTFYVSIPFSEIVTVSGTPTLHTDWGDLSYFFGSGSNVLTFQGTIGADFGVQLIVRTLDGAVTDLAGNAFSTAANNVYKAFSYTVDYPWPGSGTEADPYVITTTHQLNYLATLVNSVYHACEGEYFELGADIAYAYTTDWSAFPAGEENNFTPIGCHGMPFVGHFDGKGHTVSGIRVSNISNSTDAESLGLFGYVSCGTVQNIILRNANIKGSTNIGGIVGFLGADGSVSGCTLYQVLAGAHLANGVVGVVAGHEEGIVDCHYRDCRTARTYKDFGDVMPMPHITNCDDLFALAVGSNVTAAFATGESVAIDGATYYTAGSTFDLSYGGTLPSARVLGGFSATAGTVSGNAFTMPAADCTVSPAWASAWAGQGTPEAPYLITTTNELDLLSQMVNGQGGYGYSDFAGNYFQLGTNIAYTAATDWNDSSSTEDNYTAIGSFRSGTTYNQFKGTFDGDGHTVSGIRIYKPESSTANGYQGLFGFIGTGGTVKNVTLADARITGQLSVAGIAGLSYGSVTNCTVAANVCVASKNTDSHYHAGIVGKNQGIVSGCTSAVTLTADYAGPDYYAAVVGKNNSDGTVQNCLALGATIPAMADHYGVITGWNVTTDILTANYYRGCTVGTTENAVNVGVGTSNGSADQEGAKSVHSLTLGTDVAATGGETVVIDGLVHYAAGSAVALAYDGTPAAGTEFAGFVVADENGGASFETDGAFAMPAYDATADARFITEWAALNRRLAAGGDITLAKDYAATAEDGPLTVPAGVSVTLDLSGHILDRNLAAATNSGFVIEVYGSLVVTDGAPAATHTGALAGIPGGVITGGNNTGSGGGVIVNGSAATFTLSGGTVAGNTAQYGGGVYQYRGAFTLSGGAVAGNAAQYGGGVLVSDGAFTVEGGTVTNNTASSKGGGVYVNGGAATLSGGAVSGNSASSGGGVYVWNGTATLSGGTVSGNTASWGGGVRVDGGSFTLSGGAVSGNTATLGGGVYQYRGTATLSGGAVSENTANTSGGGVYVVDNSGALFQISGGPVVSGNAVGGAPNNVHLASGKHIDVTGELTASARLGVTAADGPGVFTEGLGARGGAENFFSDDPDWRVRLDESGGEAELFWPAFFDIAIGESAHGVVTASVNGSVVRQAAAGDAVVLSADPAAGYGLRGVVVTNAAGEAVAAVPGTGENAGGFVFEMPAASVGVEPAFEAVYPVAIADGVLHGTVAADRAAAFAGEVVTVTVAPDEGYAFGSVAVADANGDPVWLITQDGRGAQFEMPVGGAVVSARFAAYVPASYVDEDGEERNVQAILLEDWMNLLEEGVYVVTGEVACGGGVRVLGDVTLVLADGCVLRFGTPEAPLDDLAIDAHDGQLAIYGQAGGTGRLEIHNENCESISALGYAQHGGSVFVRTSGDYPCIYADNSVVLDGGSLDVESESDYGDICAEIDINILGGRLSASGRGVFAQDSITLGHRSPADSIYAADYSCVYSFGRVTINDGQALTDGTNVFTETVIANEVEAKTLTPAYRVDIYISSSGWQGRVTAGKDYFAAGETVALTIVPDSGYALGSLDVYYSGDDGNSVAVAVTNNAFTMPARDVRVIARFVPGYTVSFLPGEGGGQMASVAVPQDTWYTLPDCGFAEPEGKMFVGWLSGSGNTFRPGEEQQIDGDWTLTAIFAGYRTVTIAGDGADGVQTEWNWWDATVSEYGFAGVATGGVVRFPRGADLNFTGLPLFIDSDPALDYDANGGIYSLADATNDVTIAIIAFPAYLAGADYVVTNNYLAWAAKYGSDTNSAYEACFLLGVDPAAVPAALGGASADAPTGSLLRVVQFNATAKGFHLELASDYAPLFQPLDPDGDPDPTLLCNGYAMLEFATGLAAFASPAETIRMPAPVAIDATTGRASVDFDLGEFLALLYPDVPQAFRDQVNMPSALFIRPAITTIYPDDYTDFIYLLVAEP